MVRVAPGTATDTADSDNAVTVHTSAPAPAGRLP